MAYKYGYLMKMSKSWYKSWTERFYVLSNVGIVYMEKPSDKDVKLFPFLDFEVIEVPEKDYGKKWVLHLKTIKGKDYDMYVQAYSQQDYTEWLAALKEFKKKLDKVKKEKMTNYMKQEGVVA